jgi:hypothetical protein
VSVKTLGALEVSRAEVLRLLGGGRREPRGPVVRLVQEELARAADLVEPRAVLRLGPGGLPGSATLEPGAPLVAAVCTVGPALEARVARLIERGERARAVVADAVASASAEAAAERTERIACRIGADAGLGALARISPGYGAWPLEEQRILFDFVGPAAIGVTLTAGLMMVPRKSISCVVPLVPVERAGQERRRRCGGCDLESCPYRADGEGRSET